jgi:hypothetical protein
MTKQSIPAVVQQTVELDDGCVIEFESPKGSKWLEFVVSFRYESTRGLASFTARKQVVRGIGYWYGSRKVAGKLHKKYISKVGDMTIAKLEQVAEWLNNPPVAEVAEAVVDKTTKMVADKTTKAVAEVAEAVVDSRLDALEARLQVLEELLGKFRA